jgi:hypothetical protein
MILRQLFDIWVLRYSRLEKGQHFEPGGYEKNQEKIVEKIPRISFSFYPAFY